MDMKETKLSSTHIYQGHVIKVEVDEILLPNGKQSKRDVIRHPGAVGIVAVDDDGNVLLVRQHRYPVAKDLLEIPAGTLNPNEDPLVCADRELREETGYQPVTLVPIGGIYMAPGYTDEYLHLFYASKVVLEPLAPDDDEFLALERVPFGEVLAMIEDGRIEDSKSITGLLKVARRLGI